VTTAPASAAGRAVPWLVVAGVLVAALSLRGPIVAPTPVLIDIQEDLGIGTASAGLLTSVPVLMFAALTPVAALVIRRSGPEVALLLSLLGVLAGTFVRALPGFGWMLAGSLVIGAAITIGNVVIPVVIRRDVPPARVATVTAGYAATLNAGSLITSLGTAPLAAVIGWTWALVAWASITLAGALLWMLHMRRSRAAGDRFSGLGPRGDAPAPGAPDTGASDGHGAPASTGRIPLRRDPSRDAEALTGPLPVVPARGVERTMLRRPITWLLMLTFSGQTTAYYALTTWLPTILGDQLQVDRTSAGALASIFQGVGILGAFLVPVLTRYFPTIVPAVVICVCWLVLTGGMLVAPAGFVVWASFGAIAHAGGFVVIFSALVAVARSDAEAAGMSAFVQGGGYAIGALGAPVMGYLHEATGDWSVPLALVLGTSIVYCVLLLSSVAGVRRARA
jgi:CP family cyanate transporter-like MFS transporter